MESCLYHGQVRHRRFEPFVRSFTYPICYLYLDFDEMETVVRQLPLLTHRRWGICSLRRDQRFQGDARAWREAVCEEMQRQIGWTPSGPIRVLTLWGSFGAYFSPVNFYFCFLPDGHSVAAVLAEVSNTPWRERHYYVLWEGNRRASRQMAYQHDKEFHVSPFLALAMTYRWDLMPPEAELNLRLSVQRDNVRLLDAALSMQRHELTRGAWLRAVACYPLLPARMLAGIYYEALRLWINKAPFFPHPKKSAPADECQNNASYGQQPPKASER